MSLSKSSTTESLKQIIPDHGYCWKTDQPRYLTTRSSKWFIIGTVLLGIYVDIFLYGGTVVMIPFILQSQIDVDDHEVLRWNSYSLLTYSAAAMVSSPVAGFLADRSSRRQGPLLLGLVFLLSGTICLWAAKNSPVLLTGRALQGISCGFLWSIGLALIVDTVGRRNIGRVLGFADIALCLGIATSPPIAGVVLQTSGKHAVYGLAMGLIVIDVVMRFLLIEPKVANTWKPKDAIEQDFGEDNTSCEMIEDISQLPEVNETPYWKVLAKSWRIRGALLGTWGTAHILMSIDVAFPVWAENRFGWGPEKVGLLLLAFYGPSLLCVLTGMLADQHGSRWLVIAGFAGCMPCFWALSFCEYIPSRLLDAFVALTMLFCGVSLSFATTPVMAEIIYAVMDKQARYPSLERNSGGYGLAYGVFMTVFNFGALTACLVSEKIMEKWNWNGLMYSMVVCCMISLIPVALWTGKKGDEHRFLSRKALSKRSEDENLVLEGHELRDLP